MGIPAVVSAGPEVLEIANQTLVIVNGDNGTIVVEPDEATRSQAESAIHISRRQREAAEKLATKPAITKDGHRVEIAANIGGLEEARKAAESGAEGVGLLRTEFLFLEREQEPTEQEQFEVYRDIVKVLQGRPVILRTLDIGGDKPLPYLPMASEQNPFLGERGIRLCINKPELLTNQLRAILRSADFGPLRIMFPMVTDLSEFEKIRTIVETVRSELSAPEVELGIMIEVPSAALTAGALAPVVDFFSIGTNDLTQYTLAIDRMHSKLAHRLDGLHPAVLCLIDRVVQAAAKYGKWVGVCGELASDMQAIPLLVGLGVHELSVTVPAVAGVKAKVRSLSLHQARELAEKALQCATADQVRALSPKT
jgi:phosphocarrier protein FPr